MKSNNEGYNNDNAHHDSSNYTLNDIITLVIKIINEILINTN